MQKWEYKTIMLYSSNFNGHTGCISDAERDLNKLGKEGWELVTIVHPSISVSSWNSETQAILKRPLNE